MLSYCFNFENSILIIKRILSFLSERSSEIAFYTNFLCGHCFFFNTGLYKFAFRTYSFGKLFFHLSMFSICSVFEMPPSWTFYDIHIIFIQVSGALRFVLTLKKLLVKTNVLLSS